MKEKTSVTNDQFLVYVKKNVIDYSSRIGAIVKDWNLEKDLREKYPKYTPTSWVTIVLRNVPDIFKYDTSKWVKFVSLYIKEVKRKPTERVAKAEKPAKKNPQGIQLFLSF